MKIGFDYWNVISHYPEQIGLLACSLHQFATLPGDEPIELHVISAIGKGRIGTIEGEVFEALLDGGYESDVIFTGIHEVVTGNGKKSPELKLEKCQELGITMFFDDRQDVCDLLNANGILAFKVPRKIKSTDEEGDRQ